MTLLMIDFWSLLPVLAAVVLGIWLEKSGWTHRMKAVVKRHGRVARCRLVGAGPGDKALLTLAAKKALEEADIVIADLLVPQEILDLVKGELVMSRKYKGCANKAQDELHEWTLAALRQGLDVVRLKGGDPFLYARGAEEVNVFRKHGFDVEVVPGLSSCLSAPLSAGIAVTTRGVADQLLIATGHGKHDTIPHDCPPYYPGRTVVYLMSVSRMHNLMNRLMEPHIGYPGVVPVAVVEKATTAEQRVIRGTVETIAEICKQEDVVSPATIVVGRASEALLHSSFSSSNEFSQYVPGEGSVKFSALPLSNSFPLYDNI